MSAQIETGSMVTVRMNGEQKQLTIVEPHNTNPKIGHISWSSPLASAIIGSTVGSSVTAALPSGDTLIDVLEVL